MIRATRTAPPASIHRVRPRAMTGVTASCQVFAARMASGNCQPLSILIWKTTGM